MKPIQLAVYVSLRTALGAGRAEYGDDIVSLDEAAIQRLSPAARKLLAEQTKPAVSGGLLIVPQGGMSYRDRDGEGSEFHAVMAPFPLDVTDVSVEATIVSLERLAARFESGQQRQKTQQLTLNAQRARARAGAAAYAEQTDLAHAADADYDVVSAVADRLAIDLTIAARDRGLTVLVALVEGTRDFSRASWEERSSPRADALAVADAAEQLAEDFRMPDGWTVEASRVQRFQPCDKANCPNCYGTGCEKCQKRTAVLLTVSSPVSADRVIVLNAETR